RSNFELHASGVPAKVKAAGPLTVRLEGTYYFGKPVAGGRALVRLLRAEGGGPLAGAEGKLDAEGKASVEVAPPARLPGGKYVVACPRADDSDRTTTASLPLEVEGAGPRGGLALLPRFVPVDRAVSVPTAVTLTAVAADGLRRTFEPEKGAATLR